MIKGYSVLRVTTFIQTTSWKVKLFEKHFITKEFKIYKMFTHEEQVLLFQNVFLCVK